MGYENDTIWKEMQSFVPVNNRLSVENMPEEYYLPLLGMQVHISFLHTMVNPYIKIEPEQFVACPFLR